jgi:hypothetical protein
LIYLKEKRIFFCFGYTGNGREFSHDVDVVVVWVVIFICCGGVVVLGRGCCLLLLSVVVMVVIGCVIDADINASEALKFITTD